MLRNKSVVLLAVVLAFALFGMVQSASAQVLFGSASGTITDQSGAAVPKAHVSSVNKATGVRKETDADAGGFYRLTDLSPGLYDITVTAGGFTRRFFSPEAFADLRTSYFPDILNFTSALRG